MAERAKLTSEQRKWLRVILLVFLIAMVGLILWVCGNFIQNPGGLYRGESIGLHEPGYTAEAAIRVPQWSPDGRVLVVNTGLRIWGVNIEDGSRYLIPKLRHDGQFSPSVSDNGLVAYMDYELKDGDKEPIRRHVEVVPINGGKPKRLSENLQSSTQPVISPDGTHVAWDEYTNDAVSTVVVSAVDGSERARISMRESANARGLAWSPDGTQVAIVWKKWASVTGYVSSEFEIVSKDGTHGQTIAQLGGADEIEWGHLSLPTWLPNGHLMFFMREPGITPDGNPIHPMKIVSTRHDGSDMKTFIDLGADFKLRPEPLQPSPNWSRFAFVARSNYGGQSELYTVRTDGTNLWMIGDTGTYQGVTWSPDGNMLVVQDALADSTGDKVYMVHPTTGRKSLVQWER